MAFIYFIDNEYGLTKIGRTKRDPNERLKELPFPNLKMRFFFETDYDSKLEVALHFRYKINAQGREWFDLSDYSNEHLKNSCSQLNEAVLSVYSNSECDIEYNKRK